MELQRIGEFGLIRRIRERLGTNESGIIGIGDDCAVIHRGEQLSLLLTTDLLIERVHFLLDHTPARLLGRKSMAVNISDIAAMGGRPRYALIALALPKNTTVEFCDEFYAGIEEMCSAYGMKLLGGDTTSSLSDLMINLTVVGECRKDEILYRSGARPGDSIFLSGAVGSSAAGLHLLLAGVAPHSLSGYEQLIAAHLDPQPEIEMGRIIAQSRLATAMIDVSDGVLADLGHICEESGVGARISALLLPIGTHCREAAELLDQAPLVWALTGGEDYRLLFTVPAAGEDALVALIDRHVHRQPVKIGVITAEKAVRVIDELEREIELPRQGWDHFSPAGGCNPSSTMMDAKT